MMQIIHGEKVHLPAILELEKRCFSVPWSEQSFLSELESPDSCFLVACEEERVCGFVILHRFGPEGEIFNIAVDPALRRQGIARALLREALTKKENDGAEEVFLEVRESNLPARELYKAFGFVQVGLRKNYYEKPREDAVLMHLARKETER